MGIMEEIANEKVEWKRLGEVGNFYTGLKSKNKSDFSNGNKKYITYMNVFKNISIDLNKCEKVLINSNENQNKVKYGDILFTISSEIREEAGMTSVVTQDVNEDIYLNSFCVGYRFNDTEKINPNFMKHLFRCIQIRNDIIKLAHGVTRFNVSKEKLEKLLIPIPSLEIQEKIVERLDKFTECVTELKSELKSRVKQYNYYRDKLLSEEYLNKMELGSEIVEYAKLKDICEYSTERILAFELNSNNYVGVENLLQNREGKTISNYVPTEGNLIKFNKGNTLIGNIRPYLKKIWFADIDGGTNGDVLVIKNTSDKILPRYLYQILSTETFFDYNIQHSKGAKMPRGDKQKIMEFGFYIPPLHLQDKIVQILDKFQEYATDIKGLLPQEIELRQKQYEYYREKLLTFSENVVQPTNQLIISSDYYNLLSEAAKIVGIELNVGLEVQYKKLGDIALVTKLAGYEFTKHVNYSEQGKIIAIRGLNVKNGKLVLNDVKYIDNSNLEKLTRSKLKKGDLIYTYIGTVGEIAIIDENEKYYLAPNVAMIRVDRDIINEKYLYYYLNFTDFKKKNIEKYLENSSMKNLTMEKIRLFEIPIVSINLQNKIVQILDKFETYVSDVSGLLPEEIKLRQSQYECYREKLLTFDESVVTHTHTHYLIANEYYRILVEAARVVGVVFVEREILSDLGTFYNGLRGKNKSDFVNGNKKYITYMNVFKNLNINFDECEYVNIKESEEQNKVKFGDILFTTSSEIQEETGITSVITDILQEDIYLNSFCFGYRFNDIEKINFNFMKHLFRSEEIRRKIIRCSNGVTRFNISKEDIKEITIPIPSLAVQNHIVGVLDGFNMYINEIEGLLPQEISLRQAQYEYYRERLLNFSK